MKKFLIVIAILFVLGAGLYAVRINQLSVKSESTASSAASVGVVFDSSEYYKIALEDLKSKLGEPSRAEEWEDKEIYTYQFDGFYCEFITQDNTVVKLRLFADENWTVEKDDYKTMLAMFGVKADETFALELNNGLTYKFAPVSSTVSEFELYNYDSEAKTFDTVYITFA